MDSSSKDNKFDTQDDFSIDATKYNMFNEDVADQDAADQEMANSILDSNASLENLSVSAYLMQQLELFNDNGYKQIDIEGLDMSPPLSMIDKKKDKDPIQGHMQSETDNHVLIKDPLPTPKQCWSCLPIFSLLPVGNELESAIIVKYNILALSSMPAIGNSNVFGT